MENTVNVSRSSLANKKIVILGGSSGIGLATARAAAAEGAEVIIVSSNQSRVDAALGQLPANSKGFVTDLTNEQQIKHLFNTISKFDHLVFTAGESLHLANISDLSLVDAQRFFNVRYWGAFTAVKYASPNINPGGSITLSGGTVSRRPQSGWSLGASICTAMEGFTRAMAVELAPIRVNMVCPGLVKTNLWSNMPQADQDSLFNSYANILPVKFVAEADDVAESYLYLMRQRYSTGEVIVVDGGGVLV
ncbi:SDR family oxidoreductase [Mucilaginibacter corticis]|uniref:SDR family oxidoreductase n=1 Tax=Mucilaginibacter corticis TaxID=2597670 RepID=A0A556MW97_9SPHI|nr:SDR family oxidoreductase [Mucilaginibacter corticis]TSJ44206.1 SDR family oxidoreductase [Mucilaginibacter corticis]